jgi:hypothetical protein
MTTMKCPDCGAKAPTGKRVECPRCYATLTTMPDGTAGVLARWLVSQRQVSIGTLERPRFAMTRQLNNFHPAIVQSRSTRKLLRRAVAR